MAASYDVVFECTVCRKSFSKESVFKMHQLDCYWASQSQKTEEEAQKFRCTKCGKYFTGERTLKTHILTHNEEKCICDICGKSLTSKRSLEMHTTFYHGEENYQCEDCGKYYAVRKSYKTHKCEKCETSLNSFLKTQRFSPARIPKRHDKKGSDRNGCQKMSQEKTIKEEPCEDKSTVNIFTSDGIVSNSLINRNDVDGGDDSVCEGTHSTIKMENI